MTLELVDVQILAAALFCLGLYGVLARRSAVMILMSVELMLNAVNVNLVAFSAFRDISAVTGQVIVIFVITIITLPPAAVRQTDRPPRTGPNPSGLSRDGSEP